MSRKCKECIFNAYILDKGKFPFSICGKDGEWLDENPLVVDTDMGEAEACNDYEEAQHDSKDRH